MTGRKKNELQEIITETSGLLNKKCRFGWERLNLFTIKK
jgi:hypothetical protein